MITLQHAVGCGHGCGEHTAAFPGAAAVPGPHTAPVAPGATTAQAPVVVSQHASGCGHGFGEHTPGVVATVPAPHKPEKFVEHAPLVVSQHVVSVAQIPGPHGPGLNTPTHSERVVTVHAARFAGSQHAPGHGSFGVQVSLFMNGPPKHPSGPVTWQNEPELSQHAPLGHITVPQVPAIHRPVTIGHRICDWKTHCPLLRLQHAPAHGFGMHTPGLHVPMHEPSAMCAHALVVGSQHDPAHGLLGVHTAFAVNADGPKKHPLGPVTVHTAWIGSQHVPDGHAPGPHGPVNHTDVIVGHMNCDWGVHTPLLRLQHEPTHGFGMHTPPLQLPVHDPCATWVHPLVAASQHAPGHGLLGAHAAFAVNADGPKKHPLGPVTVHIA